MGPVLKKRVDQMDSMLRSRFIRWTLTVEDNADQGTVLFRLIRPWCGGAFYLDVALSRAEILLPNPSVFEQQLKHRIAPHRHHAADKMRQAKEEHCARATR